MVSKIHVYSQGVATSTQDIISCDYIREQNSYVVLSPRINIQALKMHE